MNVEFCELLGNWFGLLKCTTINFIWMYNVLKLRAMMISSNKHDISGAIFELVGLVTVWFLNFDLLSMRYMANYIRRWCVYVKLYI